MLLRDLKRVSNECVFNPNNPTKAEKILLDVGNPAYWTIKAIENLRQLEGLVENSTTYKATINDAIKLLLLTRAYLDEKDKKQSKTRKPVTKKDNKSTKTT